MTISISPSTTYHRHTYVNFQELWSSLKKLHRKYTFDDVSPGEKEPLGFSRAIMLAVDVAFRPFSLRLIPERPIVFSRSRLSHQRHD